MRLVLIDPWEALWVHLSKILSGNREVIGGVFNGAEEGLLERIKDVAPCIVVADTVGVFDRMEALGARLAEEGIPFIFLSDNDDLSLWFALLLISSKLSSGLREVGQREEEKASPPQVQVLDIARLSPREREVLGLIRLGFRNGMIASRLGISENTVKVHIRSIANSTGVSNRTLLAISPLNADL